MQRSKPESLREAMTSSRRLTEAQEKGASKRLDEIVQLQRAYASLQVYGTVIGVVRTLRRCT